MKAMIRQYVTASFLLCLSAVANAQLIEDVEFRREGAHAIAEIRFVTPIQYRRVITARAGDLAQAFYDVLPSRELLSLIAGQKKVVGGDGLPRMVILDETVDPSNLNRKLVIRFSPPTRFHVRAGRGGKSLEIVLEGLADAVPPPPVVARLTPATGAARRYSITLQSSAEPGKPTAALPASLRGFEIFTSTRSADGQTVHDTNLGYFATLQEAENARRVLLRRFPKSVIVTVPPAAGAAAGEPGALSAAEVDAKAAALLADAESAHDRGDHAAAVELLGQLLSLPPNASSRRAQELIAQSRLKLGDTARARGELELFLTLYPTGQDSDRVRQLLATIAQPAPEAPAGKPAAEPLSSWSGSLSAFYYGGKSKVRTQEFLDSPISALPELQSDNTISGTTQSQVQTTADLNWRYRDDETDMRFVFRDTHTNDLRANRPNRNRLSALYFDRRSLVNGTSFRVGRQSPTGGGVLYRFDGLQAGYQFAPKWKINAMAGAPSDELLDTRRRMFGVWVDAEQLTSEINGSLYFNQQTIDGEVDRRAIGTELRYFSGGVSASAQIDYDTVLHGINIATLQGTWQLPDNTVFNFLYDRRATPVLSLGNILFFQDPTLLTPARRLQDLLATTPITTLRDQVKGITAYQTQALAGVTTPVSPNWQIGGDIRLTKVGEVRPVPVIFPSGSPSTGNIWSVGGQLIGTNLYSARDTHVFNASHLRGPTFRGNLLSYNNLSSLDDKWQLEPSLRYYRQTDNTATTITRWTPGLRVTYRVLQKVSLESELSYERSKSSSRTRQESSSNAFYSIGVRYDF
ncbi:tetratricopeptide repeat protein [Polaromonas jejuensis]|uniref:Tetratricopeptide repeat protein n=1 Tax=Polaromonas jejuensis TaxID=457502 RepID=A0ABW0Q902_9BURK|nr:hypothetical protein [Polaromonas jejuensis]